MNTKQFRIGRLATLGQVTKALGKSGPWRTARSTARLAAGFAAAWAHWLMLFCEAAEDEHHLGSNGVDHITDFLVVKHKVV